MPHTDGQRQSARCASVAVWSSVTAQRPRVSSSSRAANHADRATEPPHVAPVAIERHPDRRATL
eukprot:2963497-Prymnesium_polylepis.1